MNFNPLDLRGPPFLLFFSCVLVALTLLVWGLRVWLETDSELHAASRNENLAQDPYQMALLRGGPSDLLLTALVSLLERDLVSSAGKAFCTKDPQARAKVRRPLDKAILARLPGMADTTVDFVSLEKLLEDRVIAAEIEGISSQLQKQRLLPDANCRLRRQLLLWSATALLWILALAKIMTALSRGHSNIQLLLVLGIASPFVLRWSVTSQRTAAGDRALAQITDWYSKLYYSREDLRLNETSSELTYLAAVFGVSALPGPVLSLLPSAPPPPATASWLGDSSGSSCSAGSSSCGSSCGGGGGCGGCGGS